MIINRLRKKLGRDYFEPFSFGAIPEFNAAFVIHCAVGDTRFENLLRSVPASDVRSEPG